MKYQLLIIAILLSFSGCTLNQPPYTIDENGTYVYRDNGIVEETVETMELPGVITKEGKEISLLLTKFVPPYYPPNLKEQGIEGEVDIEFQITEEGAIKKLKITDARPPEIFNYAVTSIVKQWKVKPGKYPSTYSMTLSFEL